MILGDFVFEFSYTLGTNVSGTVTAMKEVRMLFILHFKNNIWEDVGGITEELQSVVLAIGDIINIGLLLQLRFSE